MDLPSNVNYGQVVGRLLYAYGDSVGDVDVLPDATPAVGTITFTPSVARVANPSATPPVTIWPKPIVCSLDSDGYLVGPSGSRGVTLIATNDPDLIPTGWSYRVKIALSGISSPTTFDIAVPAGVVSDLSVLTPFASGTDGVLYTKGEKGDKGDKGDRGPKGDAGVLVLNAADPVPAGTAAGTVILRRN